MSTITNPIVRRLQVVFILSVLLLLASSYASYYSISKLVDRSYWVNHTYNVISANQKVLIAVQNAENAQRGYLLTKDPAALTVFKWAVDSSYNQFATLRRITGDNPLQQKNLDDFKAIMDERINHLQKLLHQDSTMAATLSVRTEAIKVGTQLMWKLRAQSAVIDREEERLLSGRVSDQTRYSTYTPILILIASFLSILITISSYFRIKSDLDARMALQEEVERKYKETAARITVIEGVTRQIAAGDYTVRSQDQVDDDLGRISHALNDMVWALQKSFTDIRDRSWLQAGAVRISEAVRGQMQVTVLSDKVVSALAQYVQAKAAVAYVLDERGLYKLTGSYAAQGAPPEITEGLGLAGQAIRDREVKIIRELPAGYLSVASALGKMDPIQLIMIPLIQGERVIGLIEMGFTVPPSELTISLIESVREPIAIAVNAAINFKKLQELLDKTQAQSEELQAQHSELETINNELEEQTQKLQASEEELKVQQEELLQTNQELEERSKLLEEKGQVIIERNIEIQRKAEELALSTKYKSEFLANMSHELRTPLNSILLLSRLMSENNEKNLTPEQIEYARVIQASGTSLLGLIDEILDLSKIESGKMTIEFRPVMVEAIVDDLRSLFAPMAREKKLTFDINVGSDVPGYVETDQIRIEQILKNLISNALKFTEQGSVSLHISKSDRQDHISFSVVDTGVGIAADKLDLIFEAFQQADGTTRRKYGGTGLGLSISRELSRLLGGSISVTSEPGKGSAFTLTIPIRKELQEPQADAPAMTQLAESIRIAPERKRYLAEAKPESIPDDRKDITLKDRVILIVEDDTKFASALLSYTRQQGYKGVVAVSGDEGIALAEALLPIGILLDIQLPVKDGWEVMEELKSNSATRHIPVHVMSSLHMRQESLMSGAVDFINKPIAFEQMPEVFRKLENVITKKDKKVLIIEENNKHAQALSYFLQSYAVNSEIKNKVEESVTALQKDGVDCVILDMGVPDQKAYKMLEEVKKNPGLENLPIIVFTGKSLSKNEEHRIKAYADSIVVKTAHSYQRILDEVSIFLHLIESNGKKAQTSKYKQLGALSEVLKGKKILVVDDDIRNVYSLTHSLEQYKVNVLSATDGKEALETLRQNPDTNIVLMDIMMPEMDGYEAIKRIRGELKMKTLPVIAVTAKAMVGDREKCIQAGASDYISKPIDIDQLMSLLRVWLYEQ